jgi:hypothetical protein
MVRLLGQGSRVIDTASWPGGLDLDDHNLIRAERRFIGWAAVLTV